MWNTQDVKTQILRSYDTNLTYYFKVLTISALDLHDKRIEQINQHA